MKKEILRTAAALILVSITLLAVRARAGNELGNGSEYQQDTDGTAWFLGDAKTVTYCYEAAPDFGVPNDTLDATLEGAFKTWVAYVKDKKINYTMDDPIGPSPLNLALSFVKKAPCDGSEDLKFYFGLTNDEVDRYRALHEEPTAFAARTAYDVAAGWGKGLVWVARSGSMHPEFSFPDWSKPANVTAILLHEIGHIFGNGHMKGTIMSPDLYKVIRGDVYTTHPAVVPTQIDGERELALCQLCGFGYEGVFGWSFPYYHDDPYETFRLFTGRVPAGKIKARIDGDDAVKNVRLRFSDDAGAFELPITIGDRFHGASEFTGSASTFRRFVQVRRTVGDVPQVGYWTASTPDDGLSYYGTATLPGGETVSIVLERNSGGSGNVGPVTVKYIRGGKVSTLFRATVGVANSQIFDWRERLWTVTRDVRPFIGGPGISCLTSAESRIMAVGENFSTLSVFDEDYCTEEIHQLSQAWDLAGGPAVFEVHTGGKDKDLIRQAVTEKFGATAPAELGYLAPTTHCPCLVFTGTRGTEAVEFVKNLGIGQR